MFPQSYNLLNILGKNKTNYCWVKVLSLLQLISKLLSHTLHLISWVAQAICNSFFPILMSILNDQILMLFINNLLDHCGHKRVFLGWKVLILDSLIHWLVLCHKSQQQRFCISASLHCAFSCILNISNEQIFLDDSFNSLIPIYVLRHCFLHLLRSKWHLFLSWILMLLLLLCIVIERFKEVDRLVCIKLCVSLWSFEVSFLLRSLLLLSPDNLIRLRSDLFHVNSKRIK